MQNERPAHCAFAIVHCRCLIARSTSRLRASSTSTPSRHATSLASSPITSTPRLKPVCARCGWFTVAGGACSAASCRRRSSGTRACQNSGTIRRLIWARRSPGFRQIRNRDAGFVRHLQRIRPFSAQSPEEVGERDLLSQLVCQTPNKRQRQRARPRHPFRTSGASTIRSEPGSRPSSDSCPGPTTAAPQP